MDLKDVIALRHQLHKYPELSGKEKKTMELLEEYLKKNPLCEIKRYPDFLLVHLKGYGKPIAFRSDMDALPIADEIDKPWKSLNEGVGHKCGHDGHMAALTGLALSVHDENHRDLYLVYQPAEETGAGSKLVLPVLLDLGITEIYGFHNWSGHKEETVRLKAGVSQCASLGLTLKFKGVKSHASIPEDGINPSLAISKLVSFDYKEVSHQGLILSTIVGIQVGNKDFGISPDLGEISFTLRAEHSSDLEALKNAYLSLGEKLAKEEKLVFSYELSDVFPDTDNDEEIVNHLVSRFKEEKIPYEIMEKPYRASEDFGLYLKQIKGCMMYMGNGEHYPDIHTRNYDFNDAILERMIQIYQLLMNEE